MGYKHGYVGCDGILENVPVCSGLYSFLGQLLGWVLRNSRPCYQDCWHTDPVRYLASLGCMLA